MIASLLIIFMLSILAVYSWNFSPNRVPKTHSLVKSNNDIAKESLSKVGQMVASTIISIATLSSTSSIVTTFPALASDEVKKKPKKPKVLETDLGIKYIELKKGSGPYPQVGDYIVISYSGFLSNGTMFDSTEANGRKPLSFRFGKKQQIEGLESVIATMQPGGECTCTIPPKYAYGTDGVCIPNEGCIVPPNETVNYVVKLRAVAPSYG